MQFHGPIFRTPNKDASDQVKLNHSLLKTEYINMDYSKFHFTYLNILCELFQQQRKGPVNNSVASRLWKRIQNEYVKFTSGQSSFSVTLLNSPYNLRKNFLWSQLIQILFLAKNANFCDLIQIKISMNYFTGVNNDSQIQLSAITRVCSRQVA